MVLLGSHPLLDRRCGQTEEGEDKPKKQPEAHLVSHPDEWLSNPARIPTLNQPKPAFKSAPTPPSTDQEPGRHSRHLERPSTVEFTKV